MWHALDISEVLKKLNTNEAGLSTEEAENRLKRFGPNTIEETKKKTILDMILNQIKDPMVYVLFFAALISVFLHEYADAFIILIIVVLNTVIGFFQEFKAERAIEALKEYSTQTAKVYRDNGLRLIETSKLVPGDIVEIEAGDIVPADIRLISSSSLKVDESILTGESVPVDKTEDVILPLNAVLGDRINMIFKGTSIVKGSARGVAVATGKETQLGRIAELVQTTEAEKTPLQIRLAEFSKKLTLIVILLCLLLLALGMLRGGDFYEIFLTSVSLAVAAIPEALPAVVSITLAIGASEMARRNALIRHLPSVETLGSTTFICTDKTGTLTLNKMNVSGFYFYGEKGIKNELNESKISEMLKLIIAYNHECKRTGDGKIIGDPTEIALLSAVFPEGFPKIDRSRTFCFLPFDSSRKMMSVGIIEGERKFLLVKGSPENILERTSYVMKNDGTLLEAEKAISAIYEEIDLLAKNGFRTIGFAFKELSNESEIVEGNLIFVGLAALIDPPRPEVREAIQECFSAGIRISMITGDHPVTARKIAEDVGLKPIKRVITGTELTEMPMDHFEEIVESVTVYARVDPEQKLKIVNALKDKGHVVAMTGDGVNDAPALKRADIGVAMGITGTEVARETADMILLDDNFATIVKAVREGRRIYENIRRFIKYTIGSNTGEIVSIVFAPLLGLPIPIKPVQILWINLVTDGLPGLAMAFEKEEPDIMKQPPRPPNESIFARNLGWHIIWVGFLLGFNTLLSYQLSHFFGWTREATTIAFTVLCLSQLGHALAIRSNKYSTFSIGFFTNRLLIFSVALTFGLQLALIYLPFLNRFFKTVPLSFEQLLFSLAISTLIFVAVEIEKWLIRRFNFYEQVKTLGRNSLRL